MIKYIHQTKRAKGQKNKAIKRINFQGDKNNDIAIRGFDVMLMEPLR